MHFYDCSFSNCNVKVNLHVSNWISEEEHDDPAEDFVSEEVVKKNPVIVEWKNLKSGEKKTYRISAGMMIPSCQFSDGEDFITASPSGRYIVIWYNKLNVDLEKGELFMMIIDTETQQLTEGSSEEFGEFIDKSSKNSYHGSCCVRILDNGLLHIVTISESYENYIMDPKTNTIIFDIDKFLESEGKFESVGKYGDPDYVPSWCNEYFVSIATPESLILIANERSSDEHEVFEYLYTMDNENESENEGEVKSEVKHKNISFKKMSKQALFELSKNYTMFPYEIKM